MALTKKQIAAFRKDPHGVSLRKIICIFLAAMRFYECWKATESDKCVKTLIADIEKCMKRK